MPKPLAEIVLEEGIADRAMVARAAAKADELGLPLVAALVRHCQIDELGLVAAIRRHVRVTITDPAAVTLDSDALRELPREVCRRQRVLPIAVQVFDVGPRRLRIAMADPTDAVAVAEVEHLTGCEVEPTLMPLSAVEELVETAYRGFVTQVIKRDRGSLFGAELVVETPAMPHEIELGAPGRTTTAPFHRVSEEADLALRQRALLKLLVRKKVISEEEYEEEVRALLKGRDGGP